VEGESDPLLNAENGKGGLTDAVAPKAPVWKSNNLRLMMVSVA